MAPPLHRRHSRDRLRFRHEVISRVHAIGAKCAHGCHRAVERLSPLPFAPDPAARNWLRYLDWDWRRRHRNIGNRSFRRLCGANEDPLYRPDPARRHWSQVGIGKLIWRTTSRRGVIDCPTAAMELREYPKLREDSDPKSAIGRIRATRAGAGLVQVSERLEDIQARWQPRWNGISDLPRRRRVRASR